MTDIQVFKPTAKGLRSERANLDPDDRFIFTGPREAICYNVTTGKIIEPFMIKSKDSFVEPVGDEVQPKLVLAAPVWRMYSRHKDKLEEMAKKYHFKIVKD